jgi:hypothetical protein
MAAVNGPPRKIMWVTHSIGEWNLAVDVGFSDDSLAMTSSRILTKSQA